MQVSTPTSIRQAEGVREVALARALFEEYAAWLNEDLCFQGFAEELATLPGSYTPPRGRLLLASAGEDVIGCIALRPLSDATHDDDSTLVGEVKRLYVKPSARGRGIARDLATRLIDDARAIGYRTLKLDTLERMHAALTLYESLGFTRCTPYYHNPLGSPVYLSLDL
ncbi:MAG TPA: GNAT family N-acetyltransferase [Casimicrobiaceae bacterium]|nr:GNAT family N-acetyltransferase [Casimicrobiaceae bacterium]